MSGESFLTLRPYVGRPSPEALAHLAEQRASAIRWLIANTERFQLTNRQRRHRNALLRDYAATLEICHVER